MICVQRELATVTATNVPKSSDRCLQYSGLLEGM